jgi:four helix bundle protein
MEIKTKSFEELDAWKKAHEFVIEIYKTTENFLKSEIFGLVSQFRRSAVSVAANIAEGYGKNGPKDKLRFYNISQGSNEECKYYIILSKDLGYINLDRFNILSQKIDDSSKLLNSYCRAISNNISK